jgi:hypothetical protein
MLEIKRLFFIYNDTRQKIIKSQVNKLAFFSCCPLPHHAHGRGEGMHGGGGRGDACASCASPLGTPLGRYLLKLRPVSVPPAQTDYTLAQHSH